MVGYLLILDNLSGSALPWVKTSHSTAPTRHGKQVARAQAQYRLASSHSFINGPQLRSLTLMVPHRFCHPTHQRAALQLCHHLRSLPVRHTRLALAMVGSILQILPAVLRLFRAALTPMRGVLLVYLYQPNVEDPKQPSLLLPP
jgi:hypothetical protein